jgi:hypothetical protein
VSGALPAFDQIAGSSFATIDAFLQFQRAAVGAARRVVDGRAEAAWAALSAERRDVFGRVAVGFDVEPAALWRRAWWLHAIGGRPRPPFEIGTTTEQAALLADALRPFEPPAELAVELDRWWTGLLAACREHIADYTAGRVAGAARRLAEEGLLAPASDQPQAIVQRHGKKRRVSDADRRRVRAAEGRLLESHRTLDVRFRMLGPVCGACTRDTGGCCSLTVPLLWREADFRLLALGGDETPRPLDETSGACPFLGLEGCRLPSERRPHICRSFLCEKAEQALGSELPSIRAELDRLGAARSQLG